MCTMKPIVPRHRKSRDFPRRGGQEVGAAGGLSHNPEAGAPQGRARRSRAEPRPHRRARQRPAELRWSPGLMSAPGAGGGQRARAGARARSAASPAGPRRLRPPRGASAEPGPPRPPPETPLPGRVRPQAPGLGPCPRPPRRGRGAAEAGAALLPLPTSRARPSRALREEPGLLALLLWWAGRQRAVRGQTARGREGGETPKTNLKHQSSPKQSPPQLMPLLRVGRKGKRETNLCGAAMLPPRPQPAAPRAHISHTGPCAGAGRARGALPQPLCPQSGAGAGPRSARSGAPRAGAGAAPVNSRRPSPAPAPVAQLWSCPGLGAEGLQARSEQMCRGQTNDPSIHLTLSFKQPWGHAGAGYF